MAFCSGAGSAVSSPWDRKLAADALAGRASAAASAWQACGEREPNQVRKPLVDERHLADLGDDDDDRSPAARLLPAVIALRNYRQMDPI